MRLAVQTTILLFPFYDDNDNNHDFGAFVFKRIPSVLMEAVMNIEDTLPICFVGFLRRFSSFIHSFIL